MKIHLLSGFLGSGKTTAIRQACATLMQQGIKVGVITNDQGIKLVDSYFFRNAGIPERQVGNGCFCCNYSDLDKNIDSLIATHKPDVIFAESVGSCTDIIATVVKPILRFRKPEAVTLTTVADARLLQMMMGGNIFDDDVQYIYYKQLEEAQVILINKIDLVDEETLKNVKGLLTKKYPGKLIFEQNSLLSAFSNPWLGHVSDNSIVSTAPSMEIDYDIYASGEAKMGYLDQQLIIRSEGQDAEQAAVQLIKTFTKQILDRQTPVGHIKFWLNDRHKVSYTSVSDLKEFDNITTEMTNTCTLIVNARVETEPEAIVNAMNYSISHIQNIIPVTIEKADTASFRPGYPKPLHRIDD